MSDLRINPENGRSEHDDREFGIFRILSDRPTPELDSEVAWSRLQARLSEKAAPDAATLRWRRPGPSTNVRLAWAAAAVVAVALGVWLAGGQPDAPAPLVLLADEPVTLAPAAAAEAPPPTTLDLDVRLVRAYSGARPADALPEATTGAGGARLLADIDATLAALVPHHSFAAIGAWQGALAEGPTAASLAAHLEMRFDASRRDGAVRLAGLSLRGAKVAGEAGELVMQPGRVYVLGVNVPGESEPLLLALRLRERPPADERPE